MKSLQLAFSMRCCNAARGNDSCRDRFNPMLCDADTQFAAMLQTIVAGAENGSVCHG